MACMERIPSTNKWEKSCSKCKRRHVVEAPNFDEAIKEFLPFFYSRDGARYPDDLDGQCKSCVRHLAKNRVDNGLTQEEMRKRQGNKCPICLEELPQTTRRNYIDHDHSTGIIRDLLCNRCNILMAGVDNEEWLKSAIAYKNRHKRGRRI